MRYTLLLHYPEMTADDLGAEALAEGTRAFDAYAKALEAAGVLCTAEMLQPGTATTTVRERDGELLVQDGPHVDTKEQLGGTFVIDVDDRDEAVAWAGRAPSVGWGAVEVRPTAIRFIHGAWTDAAASRPTRRSRPEHP